MLGPYVKPGMTVLDVGCGMGFFSIGMARMVGDEGRVIAEATTNRGRTIHVRGESRVGADVPVSL
jgi:cyclopropane fatty-acyl-phospholipid synthase-like methyltransferase